MAAAKTGELISKDLETKLYKYATTGAGIVHVTYARGASTDLEPFMYVYPKSGKYADLLFAASGENPGDDATGSYPVHVNDEGFVVAADYNFKGGVAASFGYSITIAKTDVATATAEASTAHATAAAAQNIAALPAVVSATIGAASEIDVYKITVAANDNIELSFTREPGVRVQLMRAPGGTPVLDPQTEEINVLSDKTAFGGSGTGASLAVGAWYVVVTGVTTGKKTTGKYVLGLRKVTSRRTPCEA